MTNAGIGLKEKVMLHYLSDVTRITGRDLSFAPKAIILHIRLSWYMDAQTVESSINIAFFRTSILFMTSFGYSFWHVQPRKHQCHIIQHKTQVICVSETLLWEYRVKNVLTRCTSILAPCSYFSSIHINSHFSYTKIM